MLPAQYLVFFVALAVSPFLCILAIAMSGSYEDYERVRNQCYVRAASEIFFFLAQREYLLFVFVICYLFASLCFLSLYRKWYLILCFLSFFCSLVLGIQCPFSPHSQFPCGHPQSIDLVGMRSSPPNGTTMRDSHEWFSASRRKCNADS